MGILSIKKRHRHRLSIQSVFPGFPNTLLIRKKPPAIEKRSKRDEPAPHFHFITLEPKPPARNGIPKPKQLS
ncbi:hypothetical protein ACB092_02G017900 [Castanea dentata]